MRTGAASETEGHFHETAFYSSDEEFLAIVVPFLTDGVAAGEPTLVSLSEANSQLVSSALPKSSGVSFVPRGAQYTRPAAAIRAYQELLAEYTRKGANQIRIVGDVPHPGLGVEWGWWARYEAVVNDAYDAYPLWALCPYDVRCTPADVLADVARTHPKLATVDGGHVDNPDFVDPTGFLAGLINSSPPPEPEPPAVVLRNPTAAAAREAVRHIAARRLTPIADTVVNDLVFAVSEGVENAMIHGSAPTTVRIWSYPDGFVAHVSDAGSGPLDPYTGLLRAGTGAGAGLGLWLAHQMCADISLHRHAAGFTLRIATTSTLTTH